MSESIVDQYFKRGGGDEGEPPVDPNTPVETGGLISLPASMAAMLDLRFKDGKRRGIPYGYIMDLHFDPVAGISVITSERTVTITGRGLSAVYTAILTHTALAVVESRTGFDEDDAVPFIESIVVTETSERDAEE